jgi:GrpB-like predicted nucleotidyltransferase (UPF0157 family)
VDDFGAVGLGLDRGTVRLVAARPEWAAVAAQLRANIRNGLGDRILAVEHVGSTAVPGMLAKPILDLAAAVVHDDVAAIEGPLGRLGWIYRGDTGNGDILFVYETRPQHRVAHLHVVPRRGTRWRDYLAFRDRLRSDPSARARYEATKQALLAEYPDNRSAYTSGKDSTVRGIIDQPPVDRTEHHQ